MGSDLHMDRQIGQPEQLSAIPKHTRNETSLDSGSVASLSDSEVSIVPVSPRVLSLCDYQGLSSQNPSRHLLAGHLQLEMLAIEPGILHGHSKCFRTELFLILMVMDLDI